MENMKQDSLGNMEQMNNMEDMNNMVQVENIEKQVWNMIDILKRESIKNEEYYVVLYLLSLYKDDILSKDITSYDQLKDVIGSSDNAHSKEYILITENFKSTLEQFSSDCFLSLIEVLNDIDKKVLIDSFSSIFDNVLSRIFQSQGRYSHGIIQPIELTRLICNLADLPEKSRIFNPFAGLASFGLCLEQGQEYFGQENNQSTWALGVLRLMAYNKLSVSQYLCEDSIINWPKTSEKFDFVVAHPPFGVAINQRYNDIEPGTTIEQFLIEDSLDLLNENGKLVALLPQSFLFRGTSRENRFREHLVENDLIDTIISFPGGLLSNTSIQLVILVIDKNKQMSGKVRFVKADRFVQSKGLREQILDDNELINIINNGYQDSDIVRVVDNNQIKAQNYNLSAPRYFKQNVEGVRLGDIIEIRGIRSNHPDTGKLVRLRDLKDDIIDFKLDLFTVEEMSLPSQRIEIINESCLLITTRGNSLKPTLFEFSDTPIYLHPNILSIKIKNEKVDLAYLVNELHADYVKEQLEAYRLGDFMPIIRKGDLLEVVVKLPSLEEQKAKVQGINEISGKIKILKEERDAIALGIDNKAYESFSSIKHSLGKPLLNIGSALRNIETALSRNINGWEEIKLNDKYENTVRDSFDAIGKHLKLVNDILDKNDKELDVSQYPLDEMDFIEFIRKYVNNIKSAEKTNVTTILKIHPDLDKQMERDGYDVELIIKMNENLIEIALNNIVENADKHAFVDSSKQYKLEFRVSLFDNYNFIKIEIANNGKAFPKNYSIKELTRKNSFAGKTGNTGQGGYDLDKIIKYFNNGKSTLDLVIDDSADEFASTYIFLIPLIECQHILDRL